MTTLVKNLVSNAIKFSHEGGRVDVMAREEDSNLVLNVVDRGIGISSWDLPHIFEKFYRVQSAREAGIRGTGLGLALAKDAAEVHGGTIEVESELGAGSRFTVTLPINRK
jgi:signal transduction histidine kinase